MQQTNETETQMYADLGPLSLSQPALDHTEITDPTRVEYAQILCHQSSEGLREVSGSKIEHNDIFAGKILLTNTGS